MYIITYDGQTLHDQRTDAERVTDCTCDLEANTAGSLTFTMAHDHPLYGRLAAMSAEHEVVLSQADGDGTIARELFRGRITDAGEDEKLSRTVTCEGHLAYLADSIVRPYGTYADTTDTPAQWTTIAPGTAHEYAEWLVTQHNEQTDATKRFAIGRNELPDTHITRSSTEYPDTLSELKAKVLTDLSCYARAYMQDGVRYLDFLADGGGDASQTITFGENLTDYTTARAMSDVRTCIIPVASSTSTDSTAPTLDNISDGPVAGHDGCSKQGDHVLWDAGVAKYGIRAEKVAYDDVTTDQGLLDAACTDLSTASDVVESLSISAVDLSHVDSTVGPIGLLDWVRVISPPHDVDQYILCLKVGIDIDDPTQTAYTLGATLPTLSDSNALRERETREQASQAVQQVAAISTSAAKAADAAHSTADDATEAAATAQSTADTASTAASNAQSAADAAHSTATAANDKSVSRGEQLVTNGTALMGDNTNFSAMTFDGTMGDGTPGCFARTTSYINTVFTDEFLPFDRDSQYQLSYSLMSSTAAEYYSLLAFFDADKLKIEYAHIASQPNTTTTLAADLVPGDTTITLTSAANWLNSLADSSRFAFAKGVIIWDYVTSGGMAYGADTYSRHVYNNIFSAGAIDKTTGIITLDAPWPASGGTHTAGTPISQRDEGGNLYLSHFVSDASTDTWTRKTGVATATAIAMYSGVAGTYIKPGWFLNYRNVAHTTVRLANVSLTRNTVEIYGTASADAANASAATAAKSAADAASSTATTAKTTADAASSTASQAATDAGNALTTATNAQTTAETAVTTAKDAATITITSTHGLVFKSDAISTILNITVYQPGGNKITDKAALVAAFGSTARIEWGWQREDEDGWSTILSTDSRISNDGFSLTVSPADVDSRTSFEASVVTD